MTVIVEKILKSKPSIKSVYDSVIAIEPTMSADGSILNVLLQQHGDIKTIIRRDNVLVEKIIIKSYSKINGKLLTSPIEFS